MNQENMTNEDLRIQKLMEQQANKDTNEDRRIEKLKKDQAQGLSNEDIRVQKLMERDADSPLTHTGYNDGTELYSQEEPAPVDNSLRADQIDSQQGRATLSRVDSISPVRPVGAGVDPVNFADALEQWRYMSEKYRNARVKKENSPARQQSNKEYLYNTNQFQKQYEKDSFEVSQQAEPQPPQEIAGLMDQVKNKINYFQDKATINSQSQQNQEQPEVQQTPQPPEEIAPLIDQAQDKINYFQDNATIKQQPQQNQQQSEFEEVPQPPEEIAPLIDQAQDKINYFQNAGTAKTRPQQNQQQPEMQQAAQPQQNQEQADVQQSPQLQQAPKYDQTYSNQYNENHQYIQDDSSKEDFRDRVISRLSTANLDIDPELIDEHHHDEIEVHGDVLKVSDVMTKNVISVIDSMTIEQVASIFNKKKIMGVPVIHYQTKQPVGMITMSDIIEHIFDEGFVSSFPIEGNAMFQQDSLAVLDKPIRDLMHTDVVQVDSETTVKEACKKMMNDDLHRIIITKNSKVTGIFTSFDAVRVLAQFDVKM